MAIATGLISLLINVALSRDMPFRQPQQLQCLHHGSIKAYLYSPLCPIPFSLTVYMTICGTHVMASLRDLGKCSASRGHFLHYPLQEMLPKVFKIVGDEE